MKKARVDAHVGLLIKFLNNSITNEINRNLLKFNLTATQHEVLVYILKNENKRDVFQKDVEKHLKLTNPTITGIIKRLEEKGMIVRCASTGDVSVCMLQKRVIIYYINAFIKEYLVLKQSL